MAFLLELAWQDLRASGRRLWIFVACLVLGVSLVAAGGGLYRQVADALRGDARLLFGGDVEVESPQPLPADALAWLGERGTVSRVIELRTMLRTETGRAQLIELLSADAAYPLYGSVALQPERPLAEALGLEGDAPNGQWGAAVDATLATRLGLKPGDRVAIGDLTISFRKYNALSLTCKILKVEYAESITFFALFNFHIRNYTAHPHTGDFRKVNSSFFICIYYITES